MNVSVTEIKFVLVSKQTTRTLRRPVVQLRVVCTSVPCTGQQTADASRKFLIGFEPKSAVYKASNFCPWPVGCLALFMDLFLAVACKGFATRGDRILRVESVTFLCVRLSEF